MRLLCYSAALTAGLSTLASVLAASTPDMFAFNAGVLFKEGEQTTCEVALMNSTSALVAANCLDYAFGNVNYDKTYAVLITDGKGTSMGMFRVAKAYPHPKYDAATMANNIALVQFNVGDKNTWVNPIAVNRTEWTNLYYVRRTFGDDEDPTWKPPIVYSYPDKADEGCASASDTFAANTGELLCNTMNTTYDYDERCVIPLGSVYGSGSRGMAIAAIYSYTVSYGKILCDSEKRFHYYTLLSNYLPWVASILGNTPSIYSDNPGYRLSSNTNYTMNATASANAQGMKLFGGDFVDVIDAYPTATTKTKHSSTPTGAATGSSSFTPTHTPTTPQGASSSSNTSSSGGLSQGQTIGIAVGVSVGVTLLLVAAFLGYRKWKKNQLEQGWDPRNESAHLQAIANDFAGIDENGHTLPSYNEVAAHAHRAREGSEKS